jgi:hypothetical protein
MAKKTPTPTLLVAAATAAANGSERAALSFWRA